jgi:hypothetical protein
MESTMQALNAESSVRRLIAKFANSFDVRAWNELAECLSDSVYTDYSDLRGTPPEAVTKADFVAARRAALEAVVTHHVIGNVEIYINGTSATSRISAVVYRRDGEGKVFTSHCMFLLGLQSRHDIWEICSIVQKILWTEGNAGIHGEAVKLA